MPERRAVTFPLPDSECRDAERTTESSTVLIQLGSLHVSKTKFRPILKALNDNLEDSPVD